MSVAALAGLFAGLAAPSVAEEVTGNVVFAGDSLTAGIGAGPHGSYPAQCLAILGGRWKGQNSAGPGQTVRQVLETFDAQIGRQLDRSCALNVLVLWEAGDDLVSGTTPDELASILSRITARARSSGFDKVLLLTSTPPIQVRRSDRAPGHSRTAPVPR